VRVGTITLDSVLLSLSLKRLTLRSEKVGKKDEKK
jgi:hypothetical protein